jgi:hypothetical protein
MVCSDDVPAVYRRLMAEAKAHGVPAISNPGEYAVDEG